MQCNKQISIDMVGLYFGVANLAEFQLKPPLSKTLRLANERITSLCLSISLTPFLPLFSILPFSQRLCQAPTATQI